MMKTERMGYMRQGKVRKWTLSELKTRAAEIKRAMPDWPNPHNLSPRAMVRSLEGGWYQAALRYAPHLIDQLTGTTGGLGAGARYWDEAKLDELVRTAGIETRSELYHQYGGAYQAALLRHRDWLERTLPSRALPRRSVDKFLALKTAQAQAKTQQAAPMSGKDNLPGAPTGAQLPDWLL